MYRGTFDPVSNRQDWQFIREVVDEDTDDPVDLTNATIVFELREMPEDQWIGQPAWPNVLLSATTANGKVSIIGPGLFQVWFPLSDMQTLRAGYYEVGCTVLLNGITSQLIAATLPVVDGIVSA